MYLLQSINFILIITIDEIKIFKEEYQTLVLNYKSLTFYSQANYIFDFLRPIFAVSTTYKSDLLSYDFISTSFEIPYCDCNKLYISK